MLIFGSPNAETDSLLDDCFVSSQLDYEEKPILVGKWGLGKTAILFERNKSLRIQLKKSGAKQKRYWYISESSFDIGQILELRSHFSGEKYLLELALNRLWKAEITRGIINQLSILWEYYGKPKGTHWLFIRSISASESLARPLWQHLSAYINLLKTGEVDKLEINKTKITIESLLQDFAYDQMQECLEEIEEFNVQPVIVIEPIETPDSPLEKEAGIAQITINELLNVVQRHFEISDEQKAKVMLSIPWHRYRNTELAFPQKLKDYKRTVTWNEKSLREFLSKRIAWEFKRVGRHYGGKKLEIIESLFESTIRNEFCHIHYYEDTFRYILRHSHYRARDIQRLARTIVSEAATYYDMRPDDLLKGRGGRKIGMNIIKDAVRHESRAFFMERKIEGARRYPDLENILSLIDNISIPFKDVEIRKRFTGSKLNPDTSMKILWETGFLGILIAPRNEHIAQALMSHFGADSFRKYDSHGTGKVQKWFFFEYNTGRTYNLLADKYRDSDDVEMKFILHPITFDAMGVNVSRECPMGV